MKDMTRRGFSLIEYLVVVSLIALLSGVTYPTYRRWLRLSIVQQSAEQLADLIRTAQERSVGEQQIYGVLIEPAANQASLISYGDSFAPNATYVTVDEKSFDDRTALSDVGLLDAATSTFQVRFTAAGAPSTTGTVRVSLEGDANTDYLVTVEAAGSTRVNEAP